MSRLVLLRGKLPSAGAEDRGAQVCGIKDSKNQRRKEVRRLEQ